MPQAFLQNRAALFAERVRQLGQSGRLRRHAREIVLRNDPLTQRPNDTVRILGYF